MMLQCCHLPPEDIIEGVETDTVVLQRGVLRSREALTAAVSFIDHETFDVGRS